MECAVGVAEDVLRMVGASLSDVAALVCREKILLECELGPVRLRSRDEPSVRTRFEEVIGRHDDPIVARIEDALCIDGSGRQSDKRLSSNARDDVSDR